MAISLLVFVSCLAFASSLGLREEFTWSRISYVWPPGSGRSSRQVKQPQGRYKHANSSNKDDRITFQDPDANSPTSTPTTPLNIPYIYENNIPMGANVWKNKLFITVPRRRVGVPSTLNYVELNSPKRHNTPLVPYPDWQTNTLGSFGDKFVSVYRVAIDPCDRLWFVDTGLIETPGNPDRVQPTSLVIMDLNTDRIIRRHVFNTSILRPTSTLASLTIDTTSISCGDAFAYIPDLSGYGLVVYNLNEDKAWRVNHNYFYLENTAGEFSIGGHQFQWNDGIFSIDITRPHSDGYRDAYFHSMAGHNLYKVSTRVLRNETLATRTFHDDDFKIVGNRGALSQTSSSDLHTTSGVLFLGMVNQNALGCWNVNTPLKDISIVQKNDQTMIYPSDVNVRGDDIIVLTNTMPVFLYGTLNYNETNFRVWVEDVNKAVEGTKCAQKRHGGSY